MRASARTAVGLPSLMRVSMGGGGGSGQVRLCDVWARKLMEGGWGMGTTECGTHKHAHTRTCIHQQPLHMAPRNACEDVGGGGGGSAAVPSGGREGGEVEERGAGRT